MWTQKELKDLSRKIFEVENEDGFNRLALQLYSVHKQQNPVYRQFLDVLYNGNSAAAPRHYKEIPCLPVEFFKTRKVFLENIEPETVFKSSGTGSQGAVTSTHYVGSLELYFRCFTEGFRLAWGKPEQYVFLALLPNYLQQPHSSLICMMSELIRISREKGHIESGFYLDNLRDLSVQLKNREERGQKTVLFGVSYALLDLAEQFAAPLQHTLVFETGGMKGRRREMPKEELHAVLKKSFGLKTVYSEYGMCELMSQAYSGAANEYLFSCPPWMKVRARQTLNPLAEETNGKTGALDIFDLGNIYSCPFIATQDTGRVHADGRFEVTGRLDYADIRGCNLMVD